MSWPSEKRSLFRQWKGGPIDWGMVVLTGLGVFFVGVIVISLYYAWRIACCG